MSSFSDKLAMFQNNLNKINVGNKNNEGINKNKVNENFHMLKLDEKVKTKEKEENKEIKIIPNSKKKNNIPINDIIINNTDDKKQIEKNNFDNNMKKKLSVFENKMKNNNGKSNNINKGAVKENIVSKNNSNQKVINSTNNQKQMIQQMEKKDIENKTDNKSKINNSNNLKNRLNIFESKLKNEEIKDNTEKENKEIKEKNIKIDKEKKNIEGKNNTQKINSIEIMDKSYKSSNKALNKINIEDNKFDIKSMINNLNNFSNKQKNQNDLILRRSEVINHKPKENKENSNKKSEYNKDKDITEQITYTNNKNPMKNNDIDKNNKNSSTKIDKKNDNSKNDNNYYNINKTRTEPNISLRTTSEILTPSSLLNSHKENDFSIDLNNTKEIFLSKEIHPESDINETFTMAFFISTFNFKQPKVIDKSDELAADCGHSFCSSLPAIVPEIFARYPEKDTKDFEISDLGASICFPNGIKICFEKNEMHVNGLKNYSSILTNQVGKRYFICTYHLYFKYSYEEFMKEYEYGNSIDKTLLQAIRVKSIYIPFCICLLSKYPFFTQMEKCLESLRFTIANHRINPSEIYKLLVYLTKSVPIPPVGTRINFPLPYYPDFISINQPKYKDIFLFGDNPSIILEYLSVEEIIIILRLLLFEQKVLLVGNNYDIISQIAFNFSVLLYPMQWVHTFIPIMTQKMMKYLDSFLPFFNGMHISLYELASGIFEDIKENIFIFDFNKHNFEMNTFPNLNSKNIIKKINELIPQFPKNTLNNLTFGLGVVKAYLDKSKNSNTKNNFNSTEENLGINIKIKQVFIQAFIEILYDYKSYLSLINEKPIFNTKAMLEKKPKGDYKFYKELTETQLFQVFIQNNPVNKKADTFFEEQLEIYENLKEKKEFKEEFINNYNITCEINEDYFINPEILENFDIKGNKKIKIQENLKGDEYKKILRKKYLKYDTYFKQKSILKFNKLIINDKLDFDNNKIDKNVIYYIIPNTKFNFEKEKRRKTIKRKSLLINKLGEELTPEVKDEIRENISDVITKIFKNDVISDPDESLKSVLDSLNSNYGIDLYINSLYKNKGILYKETFEFLDELIFSSINKILNNPKISKEKKMFYFLRLIKCCDNFTKDGKSLTEILYPKLDKIQMINDFNFWKEYAKLYIEDNCSKNMANDDKWIECLNKIEKIMPMMGLKKTMIYSTLADIGKNNIEESKFSDLMKEVIGRLKIYEV